MIKRLIKESGSNKIGKTISFYSNKIRGSIVYDYGNGDYDVKVTYVHPTYYDKDLKPGLIVKFYSDESSYII